MWTKIEDDEQTPGEPVMDLTADLAVVLHQIVKEIQTEEGLRPSAEMVSYKDIVGFNMQLLNNDVIRLLVTEVRGGFRTSPMVSRELNTAVREVTKELNKFEKKLRTRFKEITGKALRLSAASERCDHERVALNGLYRFCAQKTATIKTTLGGK